MGSDLVDFLQGALPRLRLRWPGYRRVRRQVGRRISRRLEELGLADLDGYRAFLEAHPEEWAVLERCCRVTISRFFRDRAVFGALRSMVLPDLARAVAGRGESLVRAWSVGCASGEEAYSLTILWELEVGGPSSGLDLEVRASDADPALLERARRARYPRSSMRELPDEWWATAFEESTGEFRLRERFRCRVTFHCEDVRREVPPGPFDLVLCRNLVFTYFDESLQREVLERLHGCLCPGGALVLGAHEQLPPDAPGLEPWPDAPRIWRATS